MSVLQAHFVMDANVAIAAMYVHPLSEPANAVLDLLADDLHVAHVPDLLFAEVANALVRLVRHPKTNLDQAFALNRLNDLQQLPLIVSPCKSLSHFATEIACAHRISAYDAMYVALSERIGAPLVTGDKKLVNLLAGTRYNIIWIEDAV